jgi:hypothetical protein
LILLGFFLRKSWHAGCNSLVNAGHSWNERPQQDDHPGGGATG